MFKNKKTYMSAGAAILAAVAAYLHGDMSPAQAAVTSLQSLALIFLRNATPDK